MGSYPSAVGQLYQPLRQQPTPQEVQAQQLGLQQQQQQVQAGAITLQEKQQELQDQKAQSAALKEWSESGSQNQRDLIPLMIKYKGSAKSVFALRRSLDEQDKMHSEIAEKDAMTGEKNVETTIKKYDLTRGALNSVLDAPDEQLGQALMQTAQQLVQQGILDPQHAQSAVQLAQQSPEAIRKAIPILNKSLTSESAQLKNAKEVADKQLAEANALNAKAEYPGRAADSLIKQRVASGTNEQGMTAAQQLEANDRKRRTNIESSRLALEQRKQAIAEKASANDATANVNPKLVGKALDDYTKAGMEAAGAQQAAADMKTFVDLARSGNKLAYAYSPVEGVLTLNTGRGVKRVNMQEIEAYGGAGSATDRIKAFFGKAASGASIPADVLNDMEALHAKIAGNAQGLYSNKLKVINSAYGSKFEPVDFAGGVSGGATAAATAQQGGGGMANKYGGVTVKP